jgi:hypothetical protein
MYVQVDLLIIISQLLLSVLPCPKVTPLSGFHCTVPAPVDTRFGQFVCRRFRVFIDADFEGEEHGQELLLVADQNGVRDAGQLLLDRLLDGNRSHVFTAGRDQQFFDSA